MAAAKTLNQDLLRWLQKLTCDRRVGRFSGAVATVLTIYINRDSGEAWPSQETVAGRLGATARGVRNALDELEATGYLRVERPGARLPNRYSIAMGHEEQPFPTEAAPSGTAVPLETLPDGNGCSGRGPIPDRNGCSAPSGTAVPPNLLSEPVRGVVPPFPPHELEQAFPGFEPPEVEAPDRRADDFKPTDPTKAGSGHGGASPPARPPKARKAKGAPTDEELAVFDAWWLVYPRHKSKQDALAAFLVVLRSGDPGLEALTTTASAYAGERAGKDPVGTKYAGTWLRGRCWEDEPDAPGPPAGFGPAPGSRPRHQWSATDYALNRIHEDRTHDEEF